MESAIPKEYLGNISALERRILKKILKLLFQLRFSRRHNHLCLEKAEGLDLLIPPDVFNPLLFGSSLFLARYLQKNPVPTGSSILDLGCGSGLQGLLFARKGFGVIATDINPQAVWATGVNAQLNQCQPYIQARTGSLYEPVASEKFDLIILNPPYYAHTPRSLLEQAFMAGTELEVLTEMIAGAANHLTPNGRALAVLSSTIPLDKTLKAAQEAGLRWQIVAKRRYWAEWHLIYEFKPVKD